MVSKSKNTSKGKSKSSCIIQTYCRQLRQWGLTQAVCGALMASPTLESRDQA